MCRMIAFSSKENTRIQSYLDHLVWMASSGKRSPHPHGWGYFVVDSSGFVSVVKSPRPIFVDSPKSTLEGTVGLFHARKASKGTMIDADRAHPYILFNGRLNVLMHNGGVEDDDLKTPTLGVDTEHILRTIVGSGVEGAIERLCHKRASSLSFVYFDGDSVYAFRHCTRLCDYYTLYYKMENGIFVVSSEPYGEDWKEMEMGELMKIKDGGIIERVVIDCT